MNASNKVSRHRDADATRAALIDAGARMFAHNGFEGCRNQAIANAAGANKAMINYHFGGKLGLYRAVIADAMDRVEPLIEDFRPGDSDAMDRWIRTLDQVFQVCPYLPAILLREHLDGGRRLQQEFRDRISRFFLTTRKVMDGNSKILQSEDPHAVHLSLVGALTFFLVSEPFREESKRRGMTVAPAPDRGDYVAYLARLFSNGLAANPSREES